MQAVHPRLPTQLGAAAALCNQQDRRAAGRYNNGGGFIMAIPRAPNLALLCSGMHGLGAAAPLYCDPPCRGPKAQCSSPLQRCALAGRCGVDKCCDQLHADTRVCKDGQVRR